MSVPITTLGKTNLIVSRLGLGTVEIGLEYGIGPKSLPTEQEAITLLKSAVELGVTYIDTARGYGLAEERVGKSGVSNMPGVLVGTKCAQFLKAEPDVHGAELGRRVREDIDTSRRNLKLDILPLVQLHIELADYTDLRELIEIMQKLQSEGAVQHVGIASRGEDVPLAALQHDIFETVQAAYSILDQRMMPRVFPAAEKKNVGIINRSVLLKGALTPKSATLPGQLQSLKDGAAAAAEIAAELGIDLPTLAMRFVISNPAVSVALLGTTKVERLQQAADAIAAGPLSSDILQRLSALAITDPDQVDPGRWPQV